MEYSCPERKLHVSVKKNDRMGQERKERIQNRIRENE